MSAIRSNLHTHTVFSDGKNTHEEMIAAALDSGFESLGFSDHAYAPYDTDCCIPEDKMPVYRQKIAELKGQYAGKIEIYAGLEVDALYLHDKREWDYIIGSVHYIKGKSSCKGIEFTAKKFMEAVEELGSVRAVAEEYGRTVIELATGYRPDVLGHLDIISKLSRKGELSLDTGAAWYREIWDEVTRKVAESGCVVEVNTAAMNFVSDPQPYPSREILAMLFERSVPVMINADAHSAERICDKFEQAQELLRQIGYRSVKVLRGGCFTDILI